MILLILRWNSLAFIAIHSSILCPNQSTNIFNTNQCLAVDRGASWRNVESRYLVKAWANINHDLIYGIDQTYQTFCVKVYKQFIALNSTNASDKAYKKWGNKADRSEMIAVALDIQNIKSGTHEINESKPTEVISKQLFFVNMSTKSSTLRRWKTCFGQKQWLQYLEYKS